MTDTEDTALTKESVELVGADWSLAEDAQVQGIVAQAAGAIAGKYKGVTTADDLKQEANIFIATNADRVREYLVTPLLGERALYRWLSHRLSDLIATDVERSNKLVPLSIAEGGSSGASE